MKEEKIAELVSQYKSLADELEKLAKEIRECDSAPIDALNYDILVSCYYATRTLQGLLSMRIGLNINESETEKETEKTDD